MAAEDLNNAIQFIQQGQSDQAQPILQALIRANPQDLTAWSWYVRSCATPEKRLQALEVCLKLNPGNGPVMEAIDKLRARLSSQPPAPALNNIPAPVQPFSSSVPGYYENTYQQNDLPAASVPAVEAAAPAEPSGELQGLLLPDEPVSRPFAWYEVWFRALTQVNAPSYFELLRDPTADPGRAYLWLFVVNIIAGLTLFVSVVFLGSGILNSLNQTGVFPSTEIDMGVLYPVLLLLIPVGSALNVFGTALLVAIYNLLARMFGGSGNFSRTMYLVGAYAAPITILA